MDAEVSHPPSTTPWTPDDQRLLERFRAGDDDAFQALVRPHLGSLLGLAQRLVGDHQWAEDLSQETLVRAYRGLGGFRGESSLRSWLFRIQIRLASEPERWQRRERATTVLDGVDIPDRLGPEPDRSTLTRELRDRLEEAMERLTPKQRTALHLRAVEGWDYGMVASALGCSRAAARMQVMTARRRILDRMGRYLAP